MQKCNIFEIENNKIVAENRVKETMEGNISQFPPNFVPLNVPEAEAGVYRYQLSFL